MDLGQYMVVTTINAPTDAILSLARNQAFSLIVVGDNKTPPDWRVAGVDFISIAAQRSSEWALASLLPENHYGRKNLGYLEAMSRGAGIIAETDDDNLPGDWPPTKPVRTVAGRRVVRHGWFNPYPHFTSERVWPRGYPLQLVSESFDGDSAGGELGQWDSSIHQYLAAGDPDVDAIYRLTMGKDDHRYTSGSVTLAPGTMTTFNSQCTIWFPEAFPLLYLPSHVSFRMTDIWRSLVAQVCLWAQGDALSYHSDGVVQVRNEHDLLRDFEDEIPGYLRNLEIGKRLMDLDLSDQRGDTSRNLVACYHALRSLDVVPDLELQLVSAWVEDLGGPRIA